MSDSLRLKQIAILLKKGQITPEDLTSLITEANSNAKAPADWPRLFHTQSEVLALPEEVEAVIKGICNVNDVVLFAGLPKHGKSWLLLSLIKVLLAKLPGTKVEDRVHWLDEDKELFEVSPSKRVLYLVPEISLRAAKRRLRKMGLIVHLYDPVTNPDGRLFLHTLTKRGKINLSDAALALAAEGADVFVDPLIRYIEGDENSAADQRKLSDKLLALATIARSLWVAHHSPKAFETTKDITTQNAVRGTGEFGAMPSIIFGVLKTNSDTTRLYIRCTDARDDDEPLGDFEVEGRPYIDDTGDFKLVVKPGRGVPLYEQQKQRPKSKAGAPSSPEKPKKIAFLKKLLENDEQNGTKSTHSLLASRLDLEFVGAEPHRANTVGKWLTEIQAEKDKLEADKLEAEQLARARGELGGLFGKPDMPTAVSG